MKIALFGNSYQEKYKAQLARLRRYTISGLSMKKERKYLMEQKAKL